MFIVLDAIDGAGKGRQRLELVAMLHKRGYKVESLEFPVHDKFYEDVIHPALQGEIKLNAASWVLAYLLDKTLQAETIRPYAGSKQNFLIADGYLTTTIAYQSLLMKQVELKKLLGYAQDFQIPKPDLAIFLDTDPQFAMRRKSREAGHAEGPDIFEKSLAKQKKLAKIFAGMAEKNIYCEWDVVDGNGSVAEVTANIVSVLKKHKLI